MYHDLIKKWDEHYCAQHVNNLAWSISDFFKRNDINEISYIDIGANVGKVYDLLAGLMTVQNAYFFEASPLLYSYLEEKYKDNSAIIMYNYAISNTDSEVCFDESSMIYQFQNNIENLNLGLSKITHHSDVRVRARKISSLLQELSDTFECKFIKIDTESMDLHILQDLITVITKFKTLPVIEFEKNYNGNNITDEQAQEILDLYRNAGYKQLNIHECHGDGLLIPEFYK
jgi:FkbM family methyltransferase